MQVVLQVAIVQEYKNTQTELNQLNELQLPALKVANVKSLSPKGRNLHIFPGYLSTTLRLSHLVFPPLLHLATCTHSLSLQFYTHSTPSAFSSIFLPHSVYRFLFALSLSLQLHFVYFSKCALCPSLHLCTHPNCLHFSPHFLHLHSIFSPVMSIPLLSVLLFFRFSGYFSISVPLSHRSFSTGSLTPLLLYFTRTLLQLCSHSPLPSLTLSLCLYTRSTSPAHSLFFHLCILYLYHPSSSILSLFLCAISISFYFYTRSTLLSSFTPCTYFIFSFAYSLQLLSVLSNHK